MSSQPSSPSVPCRVLYVEEHDDTRVILTRLLEYAGHEVHAARSCQEALNLAARFRFDVALCDIGLPDGSGHDLLRAIQKLQPVRGIALTGYGSDADIRASADAGFMIHLLKPVALAKVDDAIQRVLRAPAPAHQRALLVQSDRADNSGLDVERRSLA